MKFRILMTMTLSLLIIGLSLAFLFSYYLSSERLGLIDDQLKKSALILVSSDLDILEKNDLDKADQLISDKLGPNKIGKLFYIRNNNNDLVFKSKSAVLSKLDFPKTPTKFTIKNGDKTFRVLNLELPKNPNKILQIAIILDTENFELLYVFKKMTLYFFIIFLPILGLAIIITNYILKPLTILSAHLEQIGPKLRKTGQVDELPEYFTQFKENKSFKDDEFSILIKSISSFFERLNLHYKITKPWSYQLAHEIKTPLAILNTEIDSLSIPNINNERIALSMKEQVERISTTVSSFLDWATIENSFNDSNLYAIKIPSYIQKIKDDLDKIYTGRITINTDNSFILICNPEHLTQVLSNAILNSLKHTEGKVFIETNKYTITIKDFGNGIPLNVLERFGQPFNFGNSSTKGNGLGLAWISTLSKFYNWDINFEKKEKYFVTTFDFSKNSFGIEN